MAFDLSEFLDRFHPDIIQEWILRLHTECGEQYAKRPLEELHRTITEAFHANYHTLVYEDYTSIDQFIDKITSMRLKSGFFLSDVQKAFELFRCIVVPLMAKECTPDELCRNIEKINRCLAYTIHRFSDHFQDMHQKKILEHNRKLEEKVLIRTAALKESEKKYKTLVEEINDGYFVIQDQVIVFANKAFCKMHEYDISEVIGKNFSFFIAPSSQKQVVNIYQKSLEREPTPRVFEYLRLTKSKAKLHTEIQAKNTHYDNKLSSIGICRDITNRVKMEKRVRENERMAYIGQITTSLSHEIRNPLSAVKLNLQILSKNSQLKGNDQRRTKISIEEVIRLERILNQLLDFAKPVQLTLEYENIELIISAFTELLEMKFKEKNLSVINSFQTDMPPVLIDSEKIGQVLINLLLNATEASGPDDRIYIKTEYSTNDTPLFACILIEDEGRGFPKENTKDIFKPFFTTKTKGTGLGLTNVRRIIEAHGGHVKAKIKKGRGTLFSIFLPVGKENG